MHCNQVTLLVLASLIVAKGALIIQWIIMMSGITCCKSLDYMFNNTMNVCEYGVVCGVYEFSYMFVIWTLIAAYWMFLVRLKPAV